MSNDLMVKKTIGKLQVTLAIIKPHIIQSPHALKGIREIIKKSDFYILQTNRILLKREEAEKFYLEHKNKFFFSRLVSFMCSGHCDIHILARENAIERWRELLGPTKVFQAQFSAPESIRGCYGLTDTRNAAHGSGGAAVALSAICLPFVTPALRKICLPYVPATEQQLDNVVQALSVPLATQRQQTFGRLLVDLGSGDGRVVERASREGIASFGLELNPWLVMYSRIRAIWSGITPRPRYKRVNLWKYSLRNFSDVVIFGVAPMMEKLESKFSQELQDECRVVVCRFPLPTWKPIATFGSGVDTVWLYRVKPSYLKTKTW